MRIKRRMNGERDTGLSDPEMAARLRGEAKHNVDEVAALMEQAAEHIDRLAAFRDSFHEIRMGLDAKNVLLAEEVERQKKIIDDYAAITKSCYAEIGVLKERLQKASK